MCNWTLITLEYSFLWASSIEVARFVIFSSFKSTDYLLSTWPTRNHIVEDAFLRCKQSYFLSLDPLSYVLQMNNGQLRLPLGRPTVMAGSDHYFHTCYPSIRVRPSPPYSKSRKIKQFSSENSGGIAGLAEGIIDNTCLVISIFIFNASIISFEKHSELKNSCLFIF